MTSFIRTPLTTLAAALALAGGLSLAALPLAADEDEEHEESEERQFTTENQTDWLMSRPREESRDWALAMGGRVYDNWAAVQLRELPESTHPAYPAAGKKSGGSTWRCKECHGWDTAGADGAYGSGSHFTGIAGLRGLKGGDAAAVKAAVRGDTHGYTRAMIPDVLLDKLALWVVEGQVEFERYVDLDTGNLRMGDATRGRAIYQNVCGVCHGYEGKAINFSGDPDDPEYIGTVALGNPWETLHKVLNGQPGQPMVVVRPYGIEAAMDVIAHARTLPAE